MNFVNPEKIRFEAVRAEGAGHNVSRRDTKVHMWIQVEDLKLDDHQKELVRKKLVHRITKRDELEVTNEEKRTQEENRERALEIMEQLISEAIRENPPRVVGQ